VLWFRNVGTRDEPKLGTGAMLVDKTSLGRKGDDHREDQPGSWVKPCVHDWNGDGWPDLLVGDKGAAYTVKPPQTEDERAGELAAKGKLPELMKKWSSTFQEYRLLLNSPESEIEKAGGEREEQLRSLREKLRDYKKEISEMQEIVRKYEPRQQSHGFVWLFLRKVPKKEDQNVAQR